MIYFDLLRRNGNEIALAATVLPRVGEYVLYNNTTYEVVSVLHSIGQPTILYVRNA